MRKSAEDFANEATEAIDEGRYDKGQAFAVLSLAAAVDRMAAVMESQSGRRP